MQIGGILKGVKIGVIVIVNLKGKEEASAIWNTFV